MRVVEFNPACNALKGHKKGRKIYEIIGIIAQPDRIKVAIRLSVFQTAKQTSAILTCPDNPDLFSGSIVVTGTDSIAEIVAIREAMKAAGFRCEPEIPFTPRYRDDIEHAVKVMSDFLAVATPVVRPGFMTATYKFEA